MAESSGTTRITLLFPMESKQRLFVHTDPTGWDLRSPGIVELLSAGVRVRMKYVGYGSHGGERVLVLAPLQLGQSLRQIVTSLGGQRPPEAYVIRVPEG